MALCLRGEAYGLVSERELAGYIVMAWAIESWREPEDPEWVARIMCDRYRLGMDKVEALYIAADHAAGRA